MDFSSIPDPIFLQVFRYLSLLDRIRAGGVSVAFRRMSDIANSETKLLSFVNGSVFWDISRRCLSHLLNLCKGQLEEIHFGYHRNGVRLSKVFIKYSYPQLKKVRLDDFCDHIIDTVWKNASNLETLSIPFIRFPDDVIFERLETLECWCDDFHLETFVTRMPNLKHFKIKTDLLSYRMLDRFLGTVPRLESLSVFIRGAYGVDRALELEGNGMTAFWQLKSLRLFEVDYHYADVCHPKSVYVGDHALTRIAKSFPRLRVLLLRRVKSGSIGIAALSSLPDLRELKLESTEIFEDGIRELSKCILLEKLVVGEPQYRAVYCCVLSADTITTLLGSCHRLSYIQFSQLAGIDHPVRACSFIDSLACLEKRVITLRFYTGRRKRWIWRSSEVKDALKKLKEVSDVTVEILFTKKATCD